MTASAVQAGGGVGSGRRGTGGGSWQTTLFVLLAAGAVVAVAARTRSKKRRRTMSYVLGPDGKHVDIGAIFGLDVGGTLSKLVYFEQTRKSRKVERMQQQKRRNYTDKPFQKSTLKRSASLENLSTPRHTKALDAFYAFIQAEGSPVRAELRDDNLTFFSRVLGGELHFMRFETRYMDRVVEIVKSNRLHHSINSMGCTGGGAYKFSDLFQERLGIVLRKMDELDCLMRGLEFVLQHVVGECYTYKPDKSLSLPLPSPGAGGLDNRMSWRGSHAPGLSSPHSSSCSGAISPTQLPEAPPHEKAKPRRLPGLNLSASAPLTVAAGSTEERRPPPYGDDRGLGLSTAAEVAGESLCNDNSEVPTRERDQPASSSPSSPPGRGYGQEPRRPPTSTGAANAGNLKQEWKYKVQRSGEHVIYPYLVVNIGSGVSILKVEGPGRYERISGSSLGGGTYWGLCRLLTGCKSFDEVLDLAEMGDATMVDMTVGDIYGRGYDKFHLSSSVIASSFGKLATCHDPGEVIREEDMARALLMMITGNIGQVAYLNAVIHRATHIYFVGKMEALFLEHEGYFGALGAFLNSSYVEDLHAHAQESVGASQAKRSHRATPNKDNIVAEPGTSESCGMSNGKGGKGANKADHAAARLQHHESMPIHSDPRIRDAPRLESLRLEKSYGGFLEPVVDESGDPLLGTDQRVSDGRTNRSSQSAAVATEV